MTEMTLDPHAGIEWLAGLFPVRAARGKPLTLVFTDIEGFTAYAAAAGDRAAVRLVHQHDAAVLPAVRRHGGRMLKRLGDGLMAAFGSAERAVAAALDMQRVALARGRVRLHIGIHLGAPRMRAGDLVGHDVNVAARIAERAPGGQILVSGAVRDALGPLPARCREVRPLVVVGREPIRLYRVHPATMSAARQTGRGERYMRA